MSQHPTEHRMPLMTKLAIVIVGVLFCATLIVWSSVPRGCLARKNSCQTTLVMIGKAFKMYSAEWDDMTPTNRINGHDQFLNETCRLAGLGEAPLKHSTNFVEALAPYLEKLCDGGDDDWNILACPFASNKVYPSNWNPDAAITTYCMNWYLTETSIHFTSRMSNTLLLREMDRHAHALLRPYPSMPPNAEHPRGSGAPVFAFASPNEFGTGDVEPSLHERGSNVLCADGHVSFFLSTQLNSAPVMDDDLSDDTPPGGKASRWRVGQIWISP